MIPEAHPSGLPRARYSRTTKAPIEWATRWIRFPGSISVGFRFTSVTGHREYRLPMPILSDLPVPSVTSTEWRRVALAVLAVAALMLFMVKSRPPSRVEEPVIAPWTTAVAREKKRQETLLRTINGNLDLPLPAAYDRRWQGFLGAVKWHSDRRPEVLAAIRRRLALPPLSAGASAGSVETPRLALETAYGLFPTELEPEMRQIFLHDTDPKRLAMAGAWLSRFEKTPANHEALAASLIQRFPDWAQEPRLLGFIKELREPRARVMAQRPDLSDLLKAPFDGRPVVFSFQRIDRRQPGRAAVRHADGSFIVEPDGQPFTVTQFALSASGLPGTLTNGNTPCGIFDIAEISTTRNTAIGPSELLVLQLPLENSSAKPPWTESRYLSLLPGSWQQWWPIREAWWAGLAGRNEILAHGTAIDPTPWLDSPFSGQTPSHGCLTCDESWDPATGRRLSSEQARLVEAFRRAGGAPGYLVVVELDDQNTPVSREEMASQLK